MRLIDAAEVKRFYKEGFPDLDNGVHWSRNDIIMNLDNIPTVKAIPIEWIINWLTKQTIPALHTCDDYDAVNMMLNDWEKENG